jgi:hypothetical protein
MSIGAIVAETIALLGNMKRISIKTINNRSVDTYRSPIFLYGMLLIPPEPIVDTEIGLGKKPSGS